MTRQGGPWSRLLPGVAASCTDRLEAYARELQAWNRAVRLVGPKDLEGIRLQIVDSLLPFLRRPPPSPLLDVGSGAGLPGIPLAIALPNLAVTCVEARSKRASFLRHVSRRLCLIQVQVRLARLDAPAAAQLGAAAGFASATARAVGDIPSVLHLVGPALRRGGLAYLLLAEGRGATLPTGWVLEADEEYAAPAGLGPRRLLIARHESRPPPPTG